MIISKKCWIVIKVLIATEVDLFVEGRKILWDRLCFVNPALFTQNMFIRRELYCLYDVLNGL